MQGQCVQYSVAPSSLMPDLAAYEMAPASACTVLVQGVLVSHVSGPQWGSPDGAPAYPVETMRPSWAITAPT